MLSRQLLGGIWMINLARYYDENMDPIDTKDLFTTHIHIPSIPFENQWIGGEDGVPRRQVGAFAQPKQIEVSIELTAHGYLDYPLLRDYLYGIFGFGKPFYIVDKRQAGKRHKVVLESDFIPERHNAINGTTTIPFITSDLPYAESIGTTQDIQKSGIRDEKELWGYGMGLEAIDETLIYNHTVSEKGFRIFNAGNVPIHPFEQELKITISDIQGAIDFFELRNTTNGTRFRTTQGVSSGTIVIDGANVTRNGLAFLRDTTKEFVELNERWNEFEIVGADSLKVEFDFRFYYK